MATNAPKRDPILTDIAQLLQGRSPAELAIVRAVVQAFITRGFDASGDPKLFAIMRGWRYLSEAERNVVAGKVVMAIANRSAPDNPGPALN